MNTKPQPAAQRIALSERPIEYPAWVCDPNERSDMYKKVWRADYPMPIIKTSWLWMPAEQAPEPPTPAPASQGDGDRWAYADWWQNSDNPDTHGAWHAALARERKEIAALLPKLDDFDGTFNALADLLDECGVNVRISDAMRLLHARLSASAEKGQS